jgi:hypothetical protein
MKSLTFTPIKEAISKLFSWYESHRAEINRDVLFDKQTYLGYLWSK